MSAILNSLNAHNLLIFQLILMILVSKFMVYRALSDKTYLLLGLLSPLIKKQSEVVPFRVSNGFDLDQALCFLPILDSDCLQFKVFMISRLL